MCVTAPTPGLDRCHKEASQTCDDGGHSMASKMILLSGKLLKLAPEDVERLSVYITRGSEVLAEARPDKDGTVQINLVRSAALQESRYEIEVAVGPAGMSNHL